MKIYLYSLSNPITNKIKYFGITNNPKIRFNQHLKENKNSKKCKWIKILKNNKLLPIIKIHKISEDANYMVKLETFLIKRYYEKYHLLNILKNGSHHINAKQKEYSVFNLNGIFIKYIYGYNDIFKFLNLEKTHSLPIVGSVCSRRRNFAYGYIWRYKGDIVTQEDLERIKKSNNFAKIDQSIYVYDLKLNKIYYYNSSKKVTEHLQIQSYAISKLLKGHGYYYVCKKNYIFGNTKKELLERVKEYKDKINTKILRFNLNNELINIYNNLNQTRYNGDCIKKAIKEKTIFNNSYWKIEKIIT